MALSSKEIKEKSVIRRKDNHLCINCGKPLDREGYYCSSCLYIKRENRRKDKEFYTSHGICYRCRKEPIYGDETICPECSAKEYANTLKSRERLGREHYNKVHREWAKKHYQESVKNGICYRCGKRPADGGYKSCGICRNKNGEYKRIRYQANVKISREKRTQMGMCYFCDAPVKAGYKVCEKHWKMNVEKRRKQFREKKIGVV